LELQGTSTVEDMVPDKAMPTRPTRSTRPTRPTEPEPTSSAAAAVVADVSAGTSAEVVADVAAAVAAGPRRPKAAPTLHQIQLLGRRLKFVYFCDF
jgi:hypothetical protein